MRKRLTEIAPWLLPLRKKQRCFCFYLKMKLDKNTYSSHFGKELPYEQCSVTSNMMNENTGFDMQYQENKVHNLKLAAKTMENLLILPHETFSFWMRVRHADEEEPYKDGLVVVNGELTTAEGGGLCQMSNLLFELFLHSPLTIVERHGHAEKDFPDPDPDTLCGIDATVSEGWLDLKVRNDTPFTYQLAFAFDEKYITGILRTDDCEKVNYGVHNGEVRYEHDGNDVYEHADVYRDVLGEEGRILKSQLLYHNRVKLGYDIRKSSPQEAS